MEQKKLVLLSSLAWAILVALGLLWLRHSFMNKQWGGTDAVWQEKKKLTAQDLLEEVGPSSEETKASTQK